MVALVGPSGAGKTTLANLLPRFYDVTGGAVRIDGRDVRDFDLASRCARNIGIVAQDTFLFNDTVANNIAYGRPDVPREEHRGRAARTALADDFIRELPAGLSKRVVGERGVKLSGGQRQRLAIARALLKNAPILILDEATSHLDTESEMLVQRALANLMAQPHRRGDRAPALDHPPRRQDRGPGTRPRRRNRHARGIDERHAASTSGCTNCSSLAAGGGDGPVSSPQHDRLCPRPQDHARRGTRAQPQKREPPRAGPALPPAAGARPVRSTMRAH